MFSTFLTSLSKQIRPLKREWAALKLYFFPLNAAICPSTRNITRDF